MERARVIWEEELKLPRLKPQAPWYGYDLGAWTDELEHQAKLAVARRLLGNRPHHRRSAGAATSR